MIINMYILLWRGHLHLRKGISITVWFVSYTQKTAKESEQQGRARKPLAKVTLNLCRSTYLDHPRVLPRILLIPARVFGRAPASEKLFEKRPTSMLSQSCTREEARLRPLSVRGAPLCPRWLHTYASWSLLLAASVCRARGKDQTPPGRPIEKKWSLCRHSGTRQKWKRCFSPEKVSFRCWVASVHIW